MLYQELSNALTRWHSSHLVRLPVDGSHAAEMIPRGLCAGHRPGALTALHVKEASGRAKGF